MNTNVITIVVDNINRTLSYDGGQLILGVLNDDCAQAVYFDCPNKINSIMDGINSDDYAVFVCYKNAIGAIIRQESEKIYADGDAKIQFKWTITNDVTARAGNVSFSLCIEKKDENGKVGAEWHTTNNLVGKVLDAIHTNNYTTEEHVHDKTTYQAMQTQYAELTSQLNDLEGYVDEEVAGQVDAAIAKLDLKIPVTSYVSDNAIFSTNLYGCDEFLMTFRINISNVIADGMCGLYNGNYNTPIGLIMYEFEQSDDGQLTYTIRGTKVHAVEDTSVTYVIECKVGDSSDSGKVKVPSAMQGYQLTVTKDTGFKLIVSHEAKYITDAYLITK